MSVAKKPKGKASGGFFGLPLRGLLGAAAAKAKAAKGPAGRAVLLGADAKLSQALKDLGLPLEAWQIDRLQKKRGEPQMFPTKAGPVWILLPAARQQVPAGSHDGVFEPGGYGSARDVAGLFAAQLPDFGLSELAFAFAHADAEERHGALVGLEMGAYKFRAIRQPKAGTELPSVTFDDVEAAELERARALGVSVNIARHLVNLPAGDLNPETYARAVEDLFKGSQTMKVEIWTGKRLEKERCGLLLATGQGAAFGPALVHLKYRPKGKTRAGKPVAFCGKGITFDTGGLDIKDAASMRLMKKDMGGSASVVGLAYWVEQSGLDVACDFYLALAENAIGKGAFHPGDVIASRQGLTIEIDNTDAEGRLVLADAIDVAIKAPGKDQPGVLIDLATLTGAMRVALGTRLAGMFASDDKLAKSFLQASQRRGDPAWRMPLYGEYMGHLKSVVADMANSGPSRFGGAISAALFLGRFVGTVPWIHVDMYAWTEGGGGVGEPGGNGQCIQALSEFLTNYQ